MYSEWLAYGNDAKKITEAFTAGINCFAELTKTHTHLLPPEFQMLGYVWKNGAPKMSCEFAATVYGAT